MDVHRFPDAAPESGGNGGPLGPVVKGSGIVRRYGQGGTAVDALRGVSVDIVQGRLTAVMGPMSVTSRCSWVRPAWTGARGTSWLVCRTCSTERDKLARMPANLTFEQAAAVPISGVTAHRRCAIMGE